MFNLKNFRNDKVDIFSLYLVKWFSTSILPWNMRFKNSIYFRPEVRDWKIEFPVLVSEMRFESKIFNVRRYIILRAIKKFIAFLFGKYQSSHCHKHFTFSWIVFFLILVLVSKSEIRCQKISSRCAKLNRRNSHSRLEKDHSQSLSISYLRSRLAGKLAWLVSRLKKSFSPTSTANLIGSLPLTSTILRALAKFQLNKIKCSWNLWKKMSYGGTHRILSESKSKYSLTF